ncbi:hypothetical protein ACTFIR_010100 [Dictyostelium discoideum]
MEEEEELNLKLNNNLIINIIPNENDKRLISKYPILKLYLYNENDLYKYNFDSNKVLWFVCLESGNIFQENLKSVIEKIDYYGLTIIKTECICSMCNLETKRISFQHFKLLESLIPIQFQNSFHYVKTNSNSNSNKLNDIEYKLIKTNNNLKKQFLLVNCFFNQSKCPDFSFFGCYGDTVFQFNSGYSNAHFDVVDHNKSNFNSGIFKSKKPFQILYETWLKDYEICQNSNLVIFWSVHNSIEFYYFPKNSNFQINSNWKKFGDKIYIIKN